MTPADRIKPIPVLKAEAPEIVRELSEGGEPVIMTVNGEARAVVLDVRAWEAQQETLALLKLLAMSQADAGGPSAPTCARRPAPCYVDARIRRHAAHIASAERRASASVVAAPITETRMI